MRTWPALPRRAAADWRAADCRPEPICPKGGMGLVPRGGVRDVRAAVADPRTSSCGSSPRKSSHRSAQARNAGRLCQLGPRGPRLCAISRRHHRPLGGRATPPSAGCGLPTQPPGRRRTLVHVPVPQGRAVPTDVALRRPFVAQGRRRRRHGERAQRFDDRVGILPCLRARRCCGLQRRERHARPRTGSGRAARASTDTTKDVRSTR